MTQQEINRLAATTPAAHARREQQAARVGQVWKSRDRREDRWVRVVEIDAQFAVVEPCGPNGEPHQEPRRTRVRLDPAGRLTRYRLVQDAQTRPGNRAESAVGPRTGAAPHLGTHGGPQAAQDALSPAALERLTLAAIERRAAAADGPWTLHGPDPEAQWWTIRDATGRLVAVVATAEEAMLIADAPADVSRLLAEIRRLRTALARRHTSTEQ